MTRLIATLLRQYNEARRRGDQIAQMMLGRRVRDLAFVNIDAWNEAWLMVNGDPA